MDRKRTPKRNEVSLAQLIEAGVVKAGRKIVASYKGNEVSGSILKDGRVKVEGEIYDSLSTAGRTVMSKAGNPNPSVNGWQMFKVSVDGALVPIATLREQYSAKVE